jgi:hypothetical protein
MCSTVRDRSRTGTPKNTRVGVQSLEKHRARTWAGLRQSRHIVVPSAKVPHPCNPRSAQLVSPPYVRSLDQNWRISPILRSRVKTGPDCGVSLAYVKALLLFLIEIDYHLLLFLLLLHTHQLILPFNFSSKVLGDTARGVLQTANHAPEHIRNSFIEQTHNSFTEKHCATEYSAAVCKAVPIS